MWPQASFVKLSSVWPRALGDADPCKPITGRADCKWVGAAIGWERRHFRYWWLGWFRYGLGPQMAERMCFASCWPGRALVRSLSHSCLLVIGRVFWRGAEPSVPILFVFGTCIPDWRLSIRFEKTHLRAAGSCFHVACVRMHVFEWMIVAWSWCRGFRVWPGMHDWKFTDIRTSLPRLCGLVFTHVRVNAFTQDVLHVRTRAPHIT